MFVQLVGHLGGEGAGKAHLAIGGDIAQGHADPAVALGRLGLPHLGVEALGAAVQGVGLVILRNLVALAVEAETTVGDAVAEAADGGAKEYRGVVEITLDIIEAQHHVFAVALAVGHLERLQHATVGDDGGLHAVAVGQDEFLDGGAIGQLAKARLLAAEAGRLGGKGADHE